MKENFDDEFDKVVDLLKENLDLFENKESTIEQTSMKQVIDIEFEEFFETSNTGYKSEWTKEEIEYLFSTVSQFFDNELTRIMVQEEYESVFKLSQYLYNKLLSFGMENNFVSRNKELFELFHQLWKKCYNNGSYQLKKEMMQWLVAEREDIDSTNTVGQWRTIYLMMYNVI